MALFFRIFQHLLPRSIAWRLRYEAGPWYVNGEHRVGEPGLVVGNLGGGRTIDRFFDGLSRAFGSARTFLDRVWEDIFPDTTRELEAWETSYGLLPLGTTAERVQQLESAWLETGGQSPSYLQGIIQAAGFDLYVHEWWIAPYNDIRDPRDYTTPAEVGTWRCGMPGARCGAPTVRCNGFINNAVGYLVNDNLTPIAPPAIPSDPDLWPFFVYWGPDTLDDPPAQRAQVSASRRSELERRLLKICPAHAWIVLYVEYVDTIPALLSYTTDTTFANTSPRFIWHDGELTGPFAANVVASKVIDDRVYVQIERSKTNELVRTEELDVSPWVAADGAVVVADQDTAPDGNATADEVQFGAVQTQRVQQTNGSLPDNVVHTASVFHRLSGSDPAWRLAVRNKVGAFGVAALEAAAAWARADASVDMLSGGTTPLVQAQNDAGALAGDIFAWGMQLEAATFPSSYIPALSTAVTRAGDALSIASTPAALRAGRWSIWVIPYFADADIGNSENHYVLYIGNGSYLRLRKTSGGTPHLQLTTQGGNLSLLGMTWSRYSVLKITVDLSDPVAGYLEIEGCDSGDTSATGPVAEWEQGILHVGSFGGIVEHFDGLVSQPEAAEAAA